MPVPMRSTRPRESDAVLRLDGPARYDHFVKRVVDQELAWGLWRDGWALLTDEAGKAVFPLWPAREYAALCATAEWDGYGAEEISLADLVDEVLPNLEARGGRPAVFPTPGDHGVRLTVSEFVAALRGEMEKYE